MGNQPLLPPLTVGFMQQRRLNDDGWLKNAVIQILSQPSAFDTSVVLSNACVIVIDRQTR